MHRFGNLQSFAWMVASSRLQLQQIRQQRHVSQRSDVSQEAVSAEAHLSVVIRKQRSQSLRCSLLMQNDSLLQPRDNLGIFARR